MDVPVNYFSVLVAAIVSMGLGFAWYGPMILGKVWMKERGYTQESLKKAQKESGPLYGLSFVVALITAYVLTHIMFISQNLFHYSNVATGLSAGFWMWLGFVMPTQVTATIFSDKKNWKLFGIDTGYQLVSLLAMGLVIGIF